ncbi:uncharacterized protein IL334_006120 [Kwoniella shivajii]|uniref:Uncharacterized protein n=1 Tax=Kwoniella shivajii TaxID=564305 RepID=A0ABZ1D5L8_9TREE|nr:hypothetical protein IL334_006120 [Kwoniella shivajii]
MNMTRPTRKSHRKSSPPLSSGSRTETETEAEAEAEAKGESSKYCHSCGRLLPRSKDDPTPRKYCSTTCRTHSRSSNLRDIRTDLIKAFHHSLHTRPNGGIAICSEVEKVVFGSVREPTPDPDNNNQAEKVGIYHDDMTESGKSKNIKGLSKTEEREEARRAARRLVAFGFHNQGIENEKRQVEAIQNGKAVETSFAKGEWGIRWK